MNHTAFQQFAAALEDLAREIVRACRRAARELAVMSWPAMLACCVGLALIISILPLALFLFVLFLAVKVVIGAFIVERGTSLHKTTPDKE